MNTLIEHLESISKEYNKVLDYFNKKGINTKVENSNISFLKNSKIVCMSLHSFSGWSRLAYISEFVAENKVKLTRVTDEMWFDNYMKPIIEKQLL